MASTASLTWSVVNNAARARILQRLALGAVVLGSAAAVAYPAVHGSMAPDGVQLSGASLVIALEKPALWIVAAVGLALGWANRPLPAITEAPAYRLATALLLGRTCVLALALVSGGILVVTAAVALYEVPAITTLALAGLILLATGSVFISCGIAIALVAPSRRVGALLAVPALVLLLATDHTLLGSFVVLSPTVAAESALRTIQPTTGGPVLGPVQAGAVLLSWTILPTAVATLIAVRPE